jgi:hypothetical protein
MVPIAERLMLGALIWVSFCQRKGKIMITENQFVSALAGFKAANTSGGLILLTDYAVQQAKNGNWEPMAALVSTLRENRKVWSTFALMLRAVGITNYVTVREAEKTRQWRNIDITHETALKKTVTCPETGAELRGGQVAQALKLHLATIDEVVIAEKYAELAAAEAAAREEKKETKENEKMGAEYWHQRLAKLAEEAAKYGVTIKGTVTTAAMAMAKAA